MGRGAALTIKLLDVEESERNVWLLKYQMVRNACCIEIGLFGHFRSNSGIRD